MAELEPAPALRRSTPTGERLRRMIRSAWSGGVDERPFWLRLMPLIAAGLILFLTVAVLKLPVKAQVAGIGGLLMVGYFFGRPKEALLTFFAGRLVLDLLWWLPGNFGSLNLMEIYTGAVTAMAAVLVVLDLRRVQNHPCTPALLPYVAVLLIGGLRNLELRSAAEIMARYINPLLMTLLVSAYYTERAERVRFAKVTAATSLIPVGVSVHHLVTGHGSAFMLQGYKRLLGGYENLHNHALMMLVFSAFLIWWTLAVKRWSHRLGLGLLAGLAVLCLYQTYVRTALLALAVFLVSLLALSGRRGMLAVAGLAGLVVMVATPDLQDRFKDLVLFFAPDESVMSREKLGSGRMGIWTASIGEYLSYPLGDILLGLGIGKHWLLTREAFNPFVLRKGGTVDTHSDYLTMTFQVGPLATLSYIVMQLQVLRCGWIVFKRSPDAWSRQFGAFAAALCVAATTANLVSNSFINRATLGWFFWAMAGVMFAEYQQLVRDGLVTPRRGPLSPPSLKVGPTKLKAGPTMGAAQDRGGRPSALPSSDSA